MKRFRFIIKRLLSMIVIMFLVSFLVFVVLRMSDADPLTVMIGNNQSTPELRQALTEKYHLDDPVHIQYLRWIKGVLTGDFGTDYVDGQDVKGLIMCTGKTGKENHGNAESSDHRYRCRRRL